MVPVHSLAADINVSAKKTDVFHTLTFRYVVLIVWQKMVFVKRLNNVIVQYLHSVLLFTP